MELPCLDLRLDMSNIRNFVRSAVAQCDKCRRDQTVTGISFFYSLENGFIRIQVFSNPNPFYSFLGEFYSEDLRLSNWERFYNQLFESDAVIVGHDGQIARTELDWDFEVVEFSDVECEEDFIPVYWGRDAVQKTIGRMLVSLLKQEQDQGLFEQLLKPANGKIRVGDDAGYFDQEF